jgi:hypothetical protein
MRLLDHQPNAIVRYRLLRDVVKVPSDSPELVTARHRLLEHPWVAQLAREQKLNGVWGRFHTQDTKNKTVFITSEQAIQRALALGLDKDTPILVKAVKYMEEVLTGEAVWSDWVEKSEGWPIGVEAITAATLAQVDPDHPALGPVHEYWVRVASRSFPNGVYNPEAEWNAHKESRGVGIRYLRSRYALTLLGFYTTAMPTDLDQQIINWIWHEPQGIGYLGTDVQRPSIRSVLSWLKSLEILCHYSTFREMAEPAVDWLWSQRNSEGLWEFGAKAKDPAYFPLSDNWRKAGSRMIDHSTRVLALLRDVI